MAQFVQIPPDRVPADVLQALLEEFASRDGTDYGLQEVALESKVASLHRQLLASDVQLLFDAESEEWDLVDRETAERLLEN
ncbi:MAG: YheU family protein [Halioglobus sp.]